jgi:hypothetical protein
METFQHDYSATSLGGGKLKRRLDNLNERNVGSRRVPTMALIVFDGNGRVTEAGRRMSSEISSAR